MSAIIDVTQNESGTWTAKGQYGEIYAEITCKDKKKALLALNRAFFDFSLHAKEAAMSAQLTDRELLEFAAKACGYPKISDEAGSMITAFMYDRRWVFWNPLIDDADAFRLALKLGICIQFIPECDTVQVYQERAVSGEPFNVHVAGLGDIETRRVITQAAAEIGKVMP